jgi:hypothetical protein
VFYVGEEISKRWKKFFCCGKRNHELSHALLYKDGSRARSDLKIGGGIDCEQL